jgi:hypothetical protein
MPTLEQTSAIVDKVRRRLQEAERENVFLKVNGEKLDDDWLYIVVIPTKVGIRASEYANFMAKIERELRQQGDENVLLVPALQD